MSRKDPTVTVQRFEMGGDGTPDPEAVMAAIQNAMAGIGGDDFDRAKNPDPAESLRLLGAHFTRYVRSYGTIAAERHPFKPGDFIVPAEGATVSSLGQPHIVLETREHAPYFYTTSEVSTGSNMFGCRLDMRIAYVMLGRSTKRLGVVSHWVESCEYELYEI